MPDRQSMIAARIAPRMTLMLAFIAATALGQKQPVQFPHNTHLKLGLACIDCHTGADIRADAGLPSVTKCMLCHAKLARERPEVKKVIAYAYKN